MKKLKKIFFFGLSLIFVNPIQARVLSLDKEKFSSYLIFGGATSTLNDGLWSGESSAVAFSESITQVTSGEFGFLMNSPKFVFRFGLEILQAPAYKRVAAENVGGSELYIFKNDFQVLTPKIGGEIVLVSQGTNRSLIGAYYGTASLTNKKTYSDSTISPVGSHLVELSATSTGYGVYFGHERHFADTNTLMFELGYRTQEFSEIKYAKAVTTFTGSQAKGDLYKDTDGNLKTVSLTGPYVSLGVRFYIF